MKVIKGDHSPFDSDACLDWALYCQNTGHDIDTHIEIEIEDFYKKINHDEKG